MKGNRRLYPLPVPRWPCMPNLSHHLWRNCISYSIVPHGLHWPVTFAPEFEGESTTVLVKFAEITTGSIDAIEQTFSDEGRPAVFVDPGASQQGLRMGAPRIPGTDDTSALTLHFRGAMGSAGLGGSFCWGRQPESTSSAYEHAFYESGGKIYFYPRYGSGSGASNGSVYNYPFQPLVLTGSCAFGVTNGCKVYSNLQDTVTQRTVSGTGEFDYPLAFSWGWMTGTGVPIFFSEGGEWKDRALGWDDAMELQDPYGVPSMWEEYGRIGYFVGGVAPPAPAPTPQQYQVIL